LQRFLPLKANIAQMYAKNLSLALLHLVFNNPATLSVHQGDSGTTPRILQLCLFLEQHWDKVSIFEDLRPYVEELSFHETKHLLHQLFPKIIGAVS